MIRWCDNLYMDQKVKLEREKYMDALESEKKVFGLYCVSLAINQNNLFDIISANELLLNYYRNKNMYVVGLAMGRKSAMELVAHIIEDIYRDTKDIKVKDYFSFF